MNTAAVAAGLALTRLTAAEPPFDELPVWGWVILMVVCLASLVVAVLYAVTLQGAMNAIGEGTRPFNGAFVWFFLVPCVGPIWLMVFIILLSTSLRKECELRGIPGDGAQGISIALVACYVLSIIPYIGILAALASLVLWIIHWVKMAEYRRTLLAG